MHFLGFLSGVAIIAVTLGGAGAYVRVTEEEVSMNSNAR